MQSSLLAAIVPQELRHAAFAQQRVAANLGLGLGGLIGGLLVTVGRPETFTRLFLLNAATFLVYVVLPAAAAADPGPAPRRGRPAGYREVLRDRPFRGVALVHFLLVAGGVSLLASLFPVYARNNAGAGERTIGALFLINSLLIVLAQLPVARAHEGHRRMTGLALTAGLFAATWALVLGAPVARAGRPGGRNAGLRARRVRLRHRRGPARRRPRPGEPRPLHGCERLRVAARLHRRPGRRRPPPGRGRPVAGGDRRLPRRGRRRARRGALDPGGVQEDAAGRA